MTVDDPFFQSFFPHLMSDLNIQIDGIRAQQERFLADMRRSVDQEPKGPRVATRRWFSWMQAQSHHDRRWHQVLMAVTHIGMVLGTYKTCRDRPSWGGHVAAKSLQDEPKPATHEERAVTEKRSAQANQDKASIKTVEAAASSSGAQSSSEAWKGGGDHLMKSDDDNLSKLRKAFSSSLFVTAAVLSREGLQHLTRAIRVFTGPVYDTHSEDAAKVS